MLRDWTDSTSLDGISAEGERLFTRLIMKADDYGRFHADPRLVRALCFPLSDSVKSDTVRKWMDELHAAGLLFRYDVGGKSFVAIVNFGQRLKQSRAKFPEPDGESHDWLPVSGNFREVAGSSGLNTKGNRKETETETDSARWRVDAFDEFWQAYPNRKSRANAVKAWAKATKATPATTIMAAIEKLKASHAWTKDAGRYIPHPASWLNAEGWLDEVLIEVPSPSVPTSRPFNPEEWK